MKSVVKKKENSKNAAKSQEAQCCAKISKNVAGCHD
jgi:hypothetical protein